VDIDNLANVMREEKGRHLVADILALCGVGCYGTTGNPINDAYSNGRRAVGEDLMQQIRQIESASESGDGLALEYTMRREMQRRLQEEGNNYE